MTDEKDTNNNNSQDNFQDESMAIEFPDWDLMPPDLLLKRGKNENA